MKFYNSSLRQILFALALLLCSSLVQAQNVGVTLLPPPPNQMHLSDLWRILLFNNDTRNYSIYLHATAYVGFDRSGKLIADAQSRVLDLAPTKTPLRMTGSMVQPVKVNKSDPRYESVIRSSGTVPSGDYFFCVEVVESQSGAVLAEACMQHSVENYSPPVLISPEDESVLLDTLPTFTWMPLAPLRTGSSIHYNIRVTEILGDQSPQQAMLANRSWFERNDLSAPMLTYPFSARAFVDKKRYAWRIEAIDAKSNTSLAQSEVWWFSRKDSVRKTTAADSVANPITDGHLAAGDQFSMGVFETKSEQRLVLSKLKSSVGTQGQVKSGVATGSDFSGVVLDKNMNASEYNLLASNGNKSGITLDKNQFAATKDVVGNVQTKLGALANQPSIEHMLWTWGRNVEGEVGFLAPGWYSDVPLPYDLPNIRQIACGANHILMLMKDGTVIAWGDNQFGQLANSSLPASNVGIPVTIPGGQKVIEVAAGMATSYALREDGQIYAWGYNANSELGLGDSLHEHLSPTLINVSGVRFSRIAARGGHALALASNGTIYGWGSNYFGEVGVGSAGGRVSVPVQVLNGDQVKDKAALGATQNLGLTQDVMMNSHVPAFRAIACGDHSSYAVGSGGNDVFAWGRNASGELMNGTTKDTSSAMRIALSGVDSISAGGAHTIVLMKDQSVKVAGNNTAGQLGETKLGISLTAHTLSGFGQVLAVTTGAAHTLMIKKSGGLWTMGMNNSGQLAQSPIFDIIYTNKPARSPARIVSLEQ